MFEPDAFPKKSGCLKKGFMIVKKWVEINIHVGPRAPKTCHGALEFININDRRVTQEHQPEKP